MTLGCQFTSIYEPNYRSPPFHNHILASGKLVFGRENNASEQIKRLVAFSPALGPLASPATPYDTLGATNLLFLHPIRASWQILRRIFLDQLATKLCIIESIERRWQSKCIIFKVKCRQCGGLHSYWG